MSDAHDEHESAIKTPKQLIIAILAAFVAPIIVIVLLVKFVTFGFLPNAGSDAQTPEAIAARIQPISDMGYTFKDASAPKQLLSGEEIYKSTCVACHGAGVAGAPKLGDVGAWAPRLKTGYDKVVGNALNGLNAMPAKGGNADLDDIEVARAVVYMANQSGGNFKEPEVKVPADTIVAK
ncbi:MAG: Cytochrome c5 [Solimicrobium sp.]|jgi:cytochrome c5|nr:Cytochrome c5 [Solimicrobium sp.]